MQVNDKHEQFPRHNLSWSHEPGAAIPAETRDLSVLDARLGPGSRRMMAKVVLPVVPVFSFLWFEDKVTRYLDNTHYFYICTTMSQMIVWEWPVFRVPRHGVYMCGCHHRRRVGRRLDMGPELVCRYLDIVFTVYTSWCVDTRTHAAAAQSWSVATTQHCLGPGLDSSGHRTNETCSRGLADEITGNFAEWCSVQISTNFGQARTRGESDI